MSASYILVVDDEPDIRDLVKEILEDEGYASSRRRKTPPPPAKPVAPSGPI
jgi:CheY-like chemotaxis protein